jgi:SOS-response transcriptional repressor LexA
MNQARFAEVLGTTQSNVSKWEKGAYPPSPELFIKISELLHGRAEALFFLEEAGVPKGYFEGTGAFADETFSTRFIEKQVDVIQVPLLHDRAAAGAGRAIDERDIELHVPMLKSHMPPGARVIALRVKGDSMAPVLLEGYVVFINLNARDPRRLIGHMVAAVEGEGVTIKWLRRSKKTLLLVPQHISPRHEVRAFSDESELRIVGEVVKWIGYPQPNTK